MCGTAPGATPSRRTSKQPALGAGFQTLGGTWGGGREGGREGEKEGGREGERERGREGERERGREGGREGGMEGERERGRAVLSGFVVTVPRTSQVSQAT